MTQTGPLVPEEKEGTLHYGLASFKMSNSALLDSTHMTSGRTRSQLNEAFNNIAQQVAASQLGSRRRQLRQQSRQLVLKFAFGRVDKIKDMPCPSGIPEGTLCQKCEASFAIEAVNESGNFADSQVASMVPDIEANIENGNLQKELDTINPDTPVRIEEGKVRKRGNPAGFHNSVAGMSYTNIAIIGICVSISILVLYCVWLNCCTSCCGGGGSSPSSSRKEIPQESESSKTENKKKGWFG